ncbi:helix-turn-helix transcriptional regulator [Halomicrobium salinisoli]|uniref:helix-turn-helix transcriptional regulator n=1 Tax=Halomicrobium salinisoli TaxID=2878391 RepID=UPI001CF09144|nr:MarR family transcriptional regulator [Halomicrobium salinisoli]
MEDVLGDVQFLANSANRIRVLEALRDGPASRRELQEETDVPRSTAARVLDDAEARGWVDSQGSQYRITPVGEVAVSEFRAYTETMQGIRHLGSAINRLPEPVLELDFRYLRDADVATPTEGNPTAPFDRGLDCIRSAERYRGLTSNSLPQYMDVIRDRVVHGQLDFEGVIEANFVEELREDPTRAAPWRDVGHRMWLYDGAVPINMHIVDETALLWLCNENQDGDDVLLTGLVESDHPAVLSWAESLYEEYRSEAEPFDPVVLPVG